jgi:hypothetical protein
VNGTLFTSELAKSVHATFSSADRRIRRKSPSGWQDGVSRIKLWWSGDYAYVCNGFARYRTTCTFRPSNGVRNRAYLQTPFTEGWYYASTMGATPLMELLQTGAYTSLTYGVAPTVLNQYRCGIPNVDAFPVGATEAFNEDASYPRGYGYTSDEYLSATPPADGTELNDLATLGQLTVTTTSSTTTAGISPGEMAAIARLQQDLREEPGRLIDHVFENKLPYSDLLTADYTLGREELALAYRSQMLHLPQYPPGYVPPSHDDPSRDAVRIISPASFPSIPLSWVRGPYAGGGGGIYETSKVIAGETGTGLIPPAPSSGILTMPAFLGPVSGKMRTISARIFDRLLCSDANFFVPEGDQVALHEAFMSHPNNPAPAETHGRQFELLRVPCEPGSSGGGPLGQFSRVRACGRDQGKTRAVRRREPQRDENRLPRGEIKRGYRGRGASRDARKGLRGCGGDPCGLDPVLPLHGQSSLREGFGASAAASGFCGV